MTRLDELAASFELLDDWEQRYEYLIELGEQLPTMPEALKTEANRVQACLSRVWISVENREEKLHFMADSESSITKGIVAVLVYLCQDLSAADVLQLDMDQSFKRLNLYGQLSPNRHVGVYAMFELIKDQARAELEAA